MHPVRELTKSSCSFFLGSVNLITKQFVVIKTFWKIEVMMLTYSQSLPCGQEKKKKKKALTVLSNFI